MMQSVAVAKNELVDMRRDLAVCSSLSYQLEKRIGNLETANVNSITQYALMPELKRDIHDVQQRLRVLSDGCTNTDLRLSKAHSQLVHKVTHLLEQFTAQNNHIKNNMLSTLMNASLASSRSDGDLEPRQRYAQDHAQQDSFGPSFTELMSCTVHSPSNSTKSEISLRSKDLNLPVYATERGAPASQSNQAHRDA